MPSEVRHRVDAGQAFPLVRFSGVLDLATAPAIRTALLDVLAGQPEAVVVDVSELRIGRPEALDVFRRLRLDTAVWPAARLALCCPRDGEDWQATGWPVWPGRPAAFDALARTEHGHRESVRLEPVLGSARLGREVITDACARWGRAALADSACIVATEMVNNVVAHARTPMVLLLATRGDGLAVAVRDESAVVPTFTGAPVSPTAYGGRGMLLIDSVADRWGNLALSRGKVVWALLTEEDDLRKQPESTGMAGPARG